MATVGGLSSLGGYPSPAVQSLARSQSVRGPHPSKLKAEFEQDLAQSGLKANVSTDELLTSIQSSIKSAIKDPSNDGKDFLQVIQSAVQKTLEENGVDTEKLTSLLQTDAPDQAGLPAFGHHGPPPSLDQTLLDLDFSEAEKDFDDKKVKGASQDIGGRLGGSVPSGDSFDAAEVASQFKRLIADLIKSLPSGSALDVQA